MIVTQFLWNTIRQTGTSIFFSSIWKMPNAVVIFLLMVGMLLVIEGKECDTDGPQRCWMIDNGEVELLRSILKSCFHWILIWPNGDQQWGGVVSMSTFVTFVILAMGLPCPLDIVHDTHIQHPCSPSSMSNFIYNGSKLTNVPPRFPVYFQLKR